jgi:alkylation response protein AidB-like acyl-CoA dehydrogenase
MGLATESRRRARCSSTRAQTDIEDTWKVLGVRGTGSQQFSLAETFVPEERTFDIPFGRPSVDAGSRVRLNMRAPLAETPLVQHRLERADIALRAARTLLYTEAARLCSADRST